jgi:hypothetical protein
MFDWLSKFDKILVTGPHRSGTRICAEMIAHDTGYEYIDEDYLYHDSMLRVCSLMERKHKIVMQAPAVCRYVHLLGKDDTAIVFMKRNIEDIAASQQRIGWQWEWLELARYDRSDGRIAEVKYQFWDQYQKEQIKHAFEIEYESLTTHPLWIANEQRQNFHARQTTLAVHYLVLDRNARPAAQSGIHCFDKISQESALIVKKKEHGRLLNDTGYFIWNMCDGRHTLQDIFDAVQDEFKVQNTDNLWFDLETFITDLVSNEFLQLDVFESTT